MSYLSRSIHLTRIALKACFEKASVVFFLKHYSCLLEQLAVGVSAQVLDFSTILFPSHYESNGLISFFHLKKTWSASVRNLVQLIKFKQIHIYVCNNIISSVVTEEIITNNKHIIDCWWWVRTNKKEKMYLYQPRVFLFIYFF